MDYAFRDPENKDPNAKVVSYTNGYVRSFMSGAGRFFKGCSLWVSYYQRSSV